MKNAQKSEKTIILPLMIPVGVRMAFVCFPAESLPLPFTVDPHYTAVSGRYVDYTYIFFRRRHEKSCRYSVFLSHFRRFGAVLYGEMVFLKNEVITDKMGIKVSNRFSINQTS
jgi:hypothetical protein